MGLGPPVCEECKIIMTLTNGGIPWHCPVCGKDGKNAKGLFEVNQSEYLRGDERPIGVKIAEIIEGVEPLED